MSTKTTFKRIALVAVAALGLSLVAVAPSNAAPAQSETFAVGATTGTVTLGGTASTSGNDTGTATAAVLVTQSFISTDSSTAGYTVSLVSGPATNAEVPSVRNADQISATRLTNVNATVAVSGLVETATGTANGRATAYSTIAFTPTVAGVYVISIKPANAAIAAVTWTVTAALPVIAKATAATVGNTAGSTLVYGPAYTYDVYDSMGGNYADPTSASTAALVTAGGVSCYSPLGYGNPCLVGRIVLSNGSTVAASQLTAATTELLTYKVTGPGVISLKKTDSGYWNANLPAGGTFETTETTANGGVGTPESLTKTFLLYTTGAPGKITVTISSGTTVIATVSAVAFGDTKTITPTVVNNPIVAAATNSGTITALVKDQEGSLVRGATVYAVSSDATVISNSYVSCGTTTSTGLVTCNLVAVAAGTANITLTTNSSATATGGVSSTPVAVRVSDGVATKVDYAFEKDTYAPGETAKITATVSNAAGVLPAGTYTVLTGVVTANFGVSGLPIATVTALLNTGANSYTVSIPTGITGDLQLIGTAAATTITATFGKTSVVNAALEAGNAATDAALEALDAANAAFDAADAALTAADAATAAAQDAADAVAALATSVTEQINALKLQNDNLRKQLVALTNLIIKIQKKVKA